MADPVTTRDAVVAMAPELAVVPASDGRWAAFIEEAGLSLATSAWGARRKLGANYFVAHRMTLSMKQASSGGRGEVQSESVGGVSRTYATSSGSSGTGSGWDATMYGVEYKRLIRIVGGGPRGVC